MAEGEREALEETIWIMDVGDVPSVMFVSPERWELGLNGRRRGDKDIPRG